MKRIILYLLLLFPIIGNTQIDLWQLQWAPDSLYCISTLSSGEPVWMECADLPGGGSGSIDSIFLNSTKDTIYLRDGSGFVSVADFLVFDSIYIQNDTIKLAYGGGAIPIGTTSNSFWALNGNNLTGERYLGTNSNHPLPIRLNGVERFRLTQAGRLLLTNPLNNVLIEGGNENVTGNLNFTMGGLASLTSGIQNTTMGLGSGRNITTQGQNTLIGFNAGENLRSNSNVAIGINALRGAVSGGATSGNQVAIGTFALENQSGASGGNTAVGFSVMRNGTNRLWCTGIGDNVMVSTTGASNTGGGVFSLTSLTSGTNNTAWGRSSGGRITTASNGVFLGFSAGEWETESNRLYIGSYNGTDLASGRLAAIIYGVMNSNRNNQILDLNAKVKPAIMGGTAVNVAGYDADGYLTTASFTPPADVTINAGNAINVAGSNPYTISYTGQDSTTVSDTPTLDLTLTGNNISGVVDTSIIATKYHVSTQIQPTDLSFSGGSGTVNLNSSTGNDVTIVQGTGTFPDLSSGNLKIDLQGNAQALHLLSGTGIMVRRGFMDFVTRSLAAGTGISITNGDGISGNPTITNTGVTSFNGSTGAVNGMITWNLAASGTAGSQPITNGATVTIQGGSGINVTRTFGTIQIDNTASTQTLSAGGTSNRNLSISGGNTLNTVLVPNGGTTSQVLKKSSNTSGDYNWAADSDNQTLSVVGSTLSITGGNSVTLPTGTDSQTLTAGGTNARSLTISGGNTLTNVLVPSGGTTGQILAKSSGTSGDYAWINNTGGLPAGTGGQSLRHNGSAWEATNIFTSFSPGGNSERLVVGSTTYPNSIVIGTGTAGTRLVVAGGIQLVPTTASPATIAGLTTDQSIGSITVGSGLTLSGGVLSAPAAAALPFGQAHNTAESAGPISTTFGNNNLVTNLTNGGVTISTGVITVPTAGTYEVTYGMDIAVTGVCDVETGVAVNGTVQGVSLANETVIGTATDFANMHRTFSITVAANSTFQLRYRRMNGTGNTVVLRNQIMSVKKIF